MDRGIFGSKSPNSQHSLSDFPYETLDRDFFPEPCESTRMSSGLEGLDVGLRPRPTVIANAQYGLRSNPYRGAGCLALKRFAIRNDSSRSRRSYNVN